ncbi:MAG: hypothetical protein FWE29_06215 [Defluviitaleaceae bacterium]|nr:hypothetical protein [Defluviitaleaceae bacterium]
MKKKIAVLAVAAIMLMGMSFTVFASETATAGFSRRQGRCFNRETRIYNGSGDCFRRGEGNFDFECDGFGRGGSGRALGSGGMMLRDGSCF